MARGRAVCEIFSRNLFRHYLRKRYKTNAAFAKKLGVSRRAVYAWIHGKSKPTWRRVVEIAKALQRSPRELIQPEKRWILDEWEYLLIDWLNSPPDAKIQTRHETRSTQEALTEIESQVSTKQVLKINARIAILLTERLGYFDQDFDDLDREVTEAEAQLADLLEPGDAPALFKEDS